MSDQGGLLGRGVWVVTPTFNERENISDLISAIGKILPEASILVVDDSSPDGTGQVVDGLQTSNPRLHVCHRPAKTGLGRAYDQGLRLALKSGATEIIHLDADGSHPVGLMPAMLTALDQADVVLASRYVKGGSMRIDPWRRFISAVGNIYIRWLLGGAVRDWSTGFKAWRAECLSRVLNQSPQAAGYAWLMETTWMARQNGAVVKEIPLVFQSRQKGQSKFDRTIAQEDIKIAWELHRRTLAKGRKM